MALLLGLRQRVNTTLVAALGCLALIAIVWVVALERIQYERADAIREAQRLNANLALAFEEQTLHAIHRADQTLLYVKRRYEHDGKVIDVADLAEELGARDRALIPGHLVTDAAGNVLQSDGRPGFVNVADRDFFGAQQRNATGALYISKPFTGRLTGRTVISLSRPLTDPHGNFRGVVAVALDPNYFLESYRKFDIGANGVIQLVGRDGTVRARRQGDRISFGTDMRDGTLLRLAAAASAGNFMSRGRSDGVQRFQSYRALSGYPLVVSVGVSMAEALADFESRKQVYSQAAIGATLFILLLGGALALASLRRDRAIGELEASEALHRATFEQAAVGVVHVSPGGVYLKVNRRCCEMLGYSQEELLGRNFADVTHPDDLARSSARIADLKIGHKPVQFEKRYLRKDGSVLSALLSTTLVRPGDGPEYFVVIIQDITDRKQAEARLHEQLDELRRFQKVTVDRELRMIELEAQLRVSGSEARHH